MIFLCEGMTKGWGEKPSHYSIVAEVDNLFSILRMKGHCFALGEVGEKSNDFRELFANDLQTR